MQEQVLGEYLKYANSHKNATYLSPNSVSQFIKVVSDWMRKETMSDVKNCSDFTLLLDESTDESNRSELSLFARIVKNGKVVNHFLDLLHLSRCDAQSISTKVFEFLQVKSSTLKKQDLLEWMAVQQCQENIMGFVHCLKVPLPISLTSIVVIIA